MPARALILATLVAALATPVAARAQAPTPTPTPTAVTPTLSLDKRCYVAATPTEREPVQVSGKGFMPLALVDVYVDNVLQQPPAGSAAPQAQTNGDVVGSVQAPYVASGQTPFTVRLTEHDDPAATVSATSKVTALTVTMSPATARTNQKIRFRGRGFTGAGAPVYAHYVFKGRDRETVRVAKPYGDCGLFSVRMRQFPFKTSPAVGAWTIQFDQEATYDPHAGRYATLKITVRPRPKLR